jgi:hypothetical protein
MFVIILDLSFIYVCHSPFSLAFIDVPICFTFSFIALAGQELLFQPNISLKMCGLLSKN